MNLSTISSASWSTYAAWTTALAAQSRLSAHLAAGADPRIIASDRANVQNSGQHLAREAGRLDVVV